MTREEAKMILEEVKIMDDSMYQYNTKYLEALDMALEALEQEPCEDVISREPFTDSTICEGFSCDECSFNRKDKGGCILEERVMNLPSAKQEPKTIQEMQAESEKYQKAFEDGYEQGYAQARFDYEQEPCEDAISRQAVIEQTYNWSKDEFLRVTNPFDYLRKRINSLPSATPQEQKTGHWIGIDEEPHEDYECDNCGYVVSTFTANIEPHTEYKYCPNCGAKMESEEKHDTDR